MTDTHQDNKPLILIIDDDEQFRRFLCELLQVSSFDTVAAINGKDGVRLYKQHEPDLVITDIMMPEMDGFEVVRAIQSDNKRVPIIAMSGYGQCGESSYLNMISTLGADAVLDKTTSSKTLVETVCRILELK